MKRKKNETTLNRAPLDKPDAERQESYCLKEHDLFIAGSLIIRASWSLTEMKLTVLIEIVQWPKTFSSEIQLNIGC